MEAAATRREQQRPSHGGDAASADERREEMVHEDTIGGELHAAHGGKVTPADVASMTTREVSVIVGTLLNVEVANTAATPRIETMPRTRTAPNVESTPTTEVGLRTETPLRPNSSTRCGGLQQTSSAAGTRKRVTFAD